jgi:protein SCO1/2
VAHCSRRSVRSRGQRTDQDDARRVRSGYLKPLAALALWIALSASLAAAALFAHPRGEAVAAPAPDLSLVDQRGHAFALADLRGRAVLVAFGYTRCSDSCPLELRALARTFHAHPELRGRLAVAFVSLDPSFDTSRVLASYLRPYGPDFIGLTGSRASVAAVARAYDVEMPSTRAGLEAHDAELVLVDRQHRLVGRVAADATDVLAHAAL